MKLLAGMMLFLLCALVGEGKARRLRHREQGLARVHELIRQIGDTQVRSLVSFREAALRCPASPERDELLKLSAKEAACLPLLTSEERACLAAYAQAGSWSLGALRQQQEALLALLQRERSRAKEELMHKGQVYRSVGYLCGAAILLLVL